MKRLISVLMLAAALFLTARAVSAHPMGNFAICHYSRLEAGRGKLHLRYVLDMAEIPTVTEKATLDSNHDGAISTAETAAYLAAKSEDLRAHLALTVGGKAAPLHVTDSDLRFAPGAGGLQTMKIRLDMEAILPATGAVTYRDGNYPARTGWKEIIALSGPGIVLQDTSVPTTDRSGELSVYPKEIIPPQDIEARFTVMPGSALGTGALSTAPRAVSGSGSVTPRDAFTEAIGRRRLTPGLMVLGLLIAFFWGGSHALSPGHGKTMVAAYLIGSRGTAKHAALLGLVVTITHTLGVFALGLITLFASRYVVPERLYPILSVVSGLSVCGVGLWLLYSRIRGLGHSHAHDHEHEPAHDAGHSHEPGGHHHHHLPEGAVTARTLIALGISGGIVPCPSALVVLLSAIALHRIVYGLALITSFSLGLASVLIAIGLMVVSARHWIDRLPASRLRFGDSILQRLPIASAAAVTLVGILLTVGNLRALWPV